MSALEELRQQGIFSDNQPSSALQELRSNGFSRNGGGALQELRSTVLSQPTTNPELPVVTFDDQGKPTVNATGYSANDLSEDRYYDVVKRYMTTRFGSQSVEDDRDKVVRKFLNNMRGFSGGNSVRAVNELAFLNSVEDDQEKQAAAEAYALYNGMEGLFGDTTFLEKAGTVGDFARTAVADPVNLVSLGLGKIVTSGGTRLITNTAQKAGTRAMMREAARRGTSAKAMDAAVTAGGKAFAEATKLQGMRTSAEIAQREALRQATATTLRGRLTSTTAREIAAVGTFDGVAAATTDYIYQNSMLRTKVQEEYNTYQTGLTAVASLVAMGGLAAAGTVFRRGAIAGPGVANTSTDAADLSSLTKSIEDYLNQNPRDTSGSGFRARTDIELKDADSQFFIKMVLGDDDLGIDGLAKTLLEQGRAFEKTSKDDTITGYLSNIIEKSDPTDVRNLVKLFGEVTGNRIKGLESKSTKYIAQALRDKLGNDGQVMNALGQASKLLGVGTKEITLDQYLEFAITGNVPKAKTISDRALGRGEGLISRLGIPEGSIPAVQNRLIRLLVSNLSTSALNITGFTAASTLNTVSDLSMGALFASGKTLKAFAGKGTLKEARKEITDVVANTQFKLANTLDLNTTLDMFRKYSVARPQAVKELVRVIPGGVENMERIAKQFDPTSTRLGQASDDVIDVIQQANLVTAQDAYTKSLEFITQMDKRLRKHFNMGYTEFFSNDNYLKMMATEKYALVEAGAVDDTLSTIFSKSYKNNTPLGEVAGFIEDARNLPGIGMLVPFGRFFNNTMAFIADHSFISLAGRIFKKPKASTYTSQELFVRGAISMTAAWSMTDREMEYIDKGLGWSQEEKANGAVVDERYEFPYAAYKAVARLWAYKRKDMEVPREVAQDIGNVFLGQFTRQLDASGQGVIDLVETFLSLEGPEIMELLGGTMSAITAQMAAAGTRFIDPLNSAVGLARGENYRAIDVNQGNSLVRKSTRYMNQIIDAVTGGQVLDERFSPTQGSVPNQASKFISTQREVDMTDLERVYNMVGVQPWTAGLRTDMADVKNRYAQLFDELNQSTATALLENPMWQNADQETKRVLFADFLTKNKQRVMRYLSTGFDTKDLNRSLLIEIDNSSSEKELQKALEELQVEEDIEKLNYQQLNTILNYLKTREELLKLKVMP